MSLSNQDDQIKRLSQDLVYQVGYAFYDVPYLIILNLMVQFEIARESELAQAAQLTTTEIRKYMGMLLTHRLVKRYVNKEKSKVPDYAIKPGEGERFRTKDVIYYYLDYREFANVTKLRIAMMRKAIDDKVMNDVGHKGYQCPHCQRTYDPLSISRLFNPSKMIFECEDDSHELIEYVPPEEDDTSDKMQRFNKATQPIRDALRNVEGVTLPSFNIVAWIAKNVKIEMGDMDGLKEGKGRIEVVLGGEEERERLERERKAEAQRVQNALPVWHTHSTITGQETSLGLEDAKKANIHHSRNKSGSSKKGGGEEEDEMLMQHYEGMGNDDDDGDDDDVQEITAVKMEVADVKVEDEQSIGDKVNQVKSQNEAENGSRGNMNGDKVESDQKVLMVNGNPKALHEITEEDQEVMTPDEYQAYYDAMLAE